MTLRRQLRNSLGLVFQPQDHILFSRLWTVPSGLVPRVSCLVASSLSIIQFSRSVVFNSLWPHEPQHTRPPCPSPTPGVYTNSCPLSWLCHPTVSSFLIPFSFCPQSFPASGSFQMSQLFTSGDQSISFSFNISPFNEHPGLISFRMDWLDLLAVQGTLNSLLQHHSSKASVLRCSAFCMVQLSHPYMATVSQLTGLGKL